jgi:hypothetical protein
MMTRQITGRRGWRIGVIFFSIITFGGLVLAFSQTSFFDKSLHKEAAGMRYAYEREDGLMGLTNTPYDYEKLDCKNCHVKTCDTCHAYQKEKKSFYSTAKAKEMDTCLKCHGKEGLVFHLCKQEGNLDVHMAKGMICVDCHKDEDVHGDGNVYKSMREPGAIKASCENCHEVNTEIKAHTVHGEKLDCTACHVSNSVSCMNCHFDTFKKTGSRDGIFFLLNCYLLLMNRDRDGKVTCGTAMSFVTNNQKFLVYSPQFSHAIQKKGKACGDCHANEATKLIQQGKPIPMMVFKEGKMETWKGVVPAVPEKLQWAYFNKEGDKWVPLESEAPEKIQWWYGKPLTEEQIKKLSFSVK